MITSMTKPRIRVGRFRPFESRPDGVIRLMFQYDPAVVQVLKQSLARWRDLAYDPAQRRMTPGGWLPEHKSWFVEDIIWPAVRADLRQAGIVVLEGPTT